jgi:hypothetical protein
MGTSLTRASGKSCKSGSSLSVLMATEISRQGLGDRDTWRRFWEQRLIEALRKNGQGSSEVRVRRVRRLLRLPLPDRREEPSAAK